MVTNLSTSLSKLVSSDDSLVTGFGETVDVPLVEEPNHFAVTAKSDEVEICILQELSDLSMFGGF